MAAKAKKQLESSLKQEIQSCNVDELILDPNNARKHSEVDVDAIARSLKEFGQQTPLVISADKTVIKGNGTLMAAMKLGWKRVNVVETTLTGSQLRAYAIADNQTALLSEWDYDKLATEIKSLSEEFVDALGFTEDEINELLSDLDLPREVVEDEVPDPPVQPVVAAGQLWLLGRHRLLCGDSTDSDDVGRLMNGVLADAIITDPPYGVSYVGKTKEALPVHNDGKDTLLPLLRKSLGLGCNNSTPGAIWYVSAPAGPQFYDFATVLREMDIWRQTLVWVKQSLVMGHSDYHYQHEAIFYGWTPGAAHKSPPDRKQTSIWEYDRPTVSREHPTMKPVLLFLKMLENSTLKGSLVYDPFLGSGTTLIASEQSGRKCFGIEISPSYTQVILQRWMNMTGQEPVLESTGESFSSRRPN